jgi:hypothetical protein
MKQQAILLVYRNREVQSALDGFGLRLGMQRSLGVLDLGLVQLEVFVGSLDYCGHRIAPYRRHHVCAYRKCRTA